MDRPSIRWQSVSGQQPVCLQRRLRRRVGELLPRPCLRLSGLGASPVVCGDPAARGPGARTRDDLETPGRVLSGGQLCICGKWQHAVRCEPTPRESVRWAKERERVATAVISARPRERRLLDGQRFRSHKTFQARFRQIAGCHGGGVWWWSALSDSFSSGCMRNIPRSSSCVLDPGCRGEPTGR